MSFYRGQQQPQGMELNTAMRLMSLGYDPNMFGVRNSASYYRPEDTIDHQRQVLGQGISNVGSAIGRRQTAGLAVHGGLSRFDYDEGIRIPSEASYRNFLQRFQDDIGATHAATTNQQWLIEQGLRRPQPRDTQGYFDIGALSMRRPHGTSDVQSRQLNTGQYERISPGYGHSAPTIGQQFDWSRYRSEQSYERHPAEVAADNRSPLFVTTNGGNESQHHEEANGLSEEVVNAILHDDDLPTDSQELSSSDRFLDDLRMQRDAAVVAVAVAEEEQAYGIPPQKRSSSFNGSVAGVNAANSAATSSGNSSGLSGAALLISRAGQIYGTATTLVEEILHISNQGNISISEPVMWPTNLFKCHGIWLDNIDGTARKYFIKHQFCRFGTVIDTILDKNYHRLFVLYDNPDSPVKALAVMSRYKKMEAVYDVEKTYRGHFYPSNEQVKNGLRIQANVKMENECFDWRTSGCSSGQCYFIHKAQNKFIDKQPLNRGAKR